MSRQKRTPSNLWLCRKGEYRVQLAGTGLFEASDAAIRHSNPTQGSRM